MELLAVIFSYPGYCLWLPPLAVALDLLLGDPQWFPHPVRGIGMLLRLLQNLFFKWRSNLQLAGILALFCALCLCAWVVTALISLPGIFGLLFTIYFSYAGLALGCLAREGRKALHAVESGDIEAGRRAVSMLVSRDVSKLEQPALYRTLAETLGENFTDAFVAPLFWLVLAGPVGLWVYKAASTADSAWGYKHEPWTLFGRAAARLDDVLAFVPARLSVLFLYFTAPNRQYWPGFRVIARQAGSMESPNSGWSMSAAAWLHNGGMGGPAVYAGVAKEKPRLGPEQGEWTPEKIRVLLEHLRKAGLCGLFCLWLLGIGIAAFFIA